MRKYVAPEIRTVIGIHGTRDMSNPLLPPPSPPPPPPTHTPQPLMGPPTLNKVNARTLKLDNRGFPPKNNRAQSQCLL